MKNNKNNIMTSEYYVGLDIGTSSVGFAATDKDYNLKKHSGKSMWGVRIFDEGKTAEERRVNRTNRRRLARRNQRLELLRMLFDEELAKIDAGFLLRLKESFLSLEDKTNGTKYSLFADADFTDKDYMKKYHTIYHLRKELAESSEPHDIRLVYLAIRHILKNRGHFLFDVDTENNQSFEASFGLFKESLYEIKGISLEINTKEVYEVISKMASKSDRIKEFGSLLALEDKADKKTVERLFSLIIGGSAKMSDIFETEVKTSISFDMGDEKLLEVADEIGDDFDLILSAKAAYDSLILEKITSGYNTISEYKIFEYEQHKADIQQLKDFVKITIADKKLYDEIFKAKKDKLANYSAYSGYKKSDKEYGCTQQEFCKYLKSKLPKEYEETEKFKEMYRRINDGTFAPKQRKTENGVSPNSLHRKELIDILKNASSYLEFLNSRDEDGISVKDKIISIFDYRIPYYVGPLKNGWAEKEGSGVIYPWNFEKKINFDASAEKFITKMTSTCTYTGEDVLPKNSLLYSEFEVLNEINNIKINGNPITVDCKKLIFKNLFVNKNKKVTKKDIETLLRSEGLFKDGDSLSGVDDNIKAQLVSYHKLKNIIGKTSYKQVEEIIKKIVLFGDDKKLLKKYLKAETGLNENDIQYLLRQKFTGWGRLSEYLLSGIVSVNKNTGEAMTVIEMLRETNENLMQLLSSKYTFKAQADNYRAEKLGIKGTPREMVDALYVSPKIRRSIWQTLRIVDEIVDIEKGAPQKIFIEVARENETEEKKKQNEAKRKPRKEQLLALYKSCKQDSGNLYDNLVNEKEENLRSKRLFLYYQQFGKCMYSEAPINLSELDEGGNFKYDIDHIFPRSKIKDDSFDNLVLVKAELNREKTNIYPICHDIRAKMGGFWTMLKERGMISDKKYERLVRHTPLTEDELASFINRQLVETRQSTKAVAELLSAIYPKTKIVYSKAGNVSEFRNHCGFVKCREINDHHHAKDAYLNVVVGNYFDVRFTSEFMKNILTENYSLKPDALYGRNVKGAWISGENGTISTVKKTMAKNNILFTVMPKEEHGQLYKVTILKKQKDLIPIKQSLDTEKYGGYGSAYGAYFAVVEHTEKGKKIRTIEAVLKHQKVEYERNEDAFAKKYWYPDAKIIVNKLLVFSQIEIDGVKYSIRGRKPGRIIYSHMHQFVMDDEYLKYVNKIIKLLNEANGNKINVLNTAKFSVEKNIEIYDYFTERINGSIYGKIIPNILEYLKNNREKFIKMEVVEQLKLIRELLKAFKCDATIPSFATGVITKNKKITGNKSVLLINQSVTGIFETKVDLLKQ